MEEEKSNRLILLDEETRKEEYYLTQLYLKMSLEGIMKYLVNIEI